MTMNKIYGYTYKRVYRTTLDYYTTLPDIYQQSKIFLFAVLFWKLFLYGKNEQKKPYNTNVIGLHIILRIY